MYNTKENTVKLLIKKNNSLEIYHSYKPFPKKEKCKDENEKKEKVKKEYTCLSTKNYIRQLKSSYISLKDRVFNNDNCIFITLTTKNIINVYDLIKRFNAFIKTLRNNYCHIEFAKVVEFHKQDKRCHIHCVLQFDKKTYISRNIIEKYWKIGRCYMSNETKTMFSEFQNIPNIDDVINVIEYMTKYKPENIKKYSYYDHTTGKTIEVQNETFFPKGFRVFTKSPHFGQVVKVKSKKITISTEQAKNLIEHYEKTRHIRKHCHYYNNETGKKLFTDRVYIRHVIETEEELEKIMNP